MQIKTSVLSCQFYYDPNNSLSSSSSTGSICCGGAGGIANMGLQGEAKEGSCGQQYSEPQKSPGKHLIGPQYPGEDQRTALWAPGARGREPGLRVGVVWSGVLPGRQAPPPTCQGLTSHGEVIAGWLLCQAAIGVRGALGVEGGSWGLQEMNR